MTAPTTVAAKATIDDKPESFLERWLIMPKLLYFLLNAYVYSFHSIMPIFFQEKWKFTYYMYGYATSVIITNFFGAMVWSSLADRTGRYKTIIISSIVLYTVVAIAILRPVFLGEDQKVLRYLYVFGGLALFNFFLSAAFPLLDAQVLGMLAVNPKFSKEQFNNQRMFGAIGHLASTLASMHIYDRKSQNSQVIFQLIISTVFALAVWIGVPDVKPVKGGHHGHHGHHASHKSDKGENLPAPKNPVLACLSNPNFMFFMIFVTASGVVRSATTNFQKPIAMAFNNSASPKDTHSHDSHRAAMTSYLDIGRTFSEVFVYLTAKYMKDSMGIYWVLVFSQMAGIVRLWGYGLVHTTSYYAYSIGIVLELLKGFNSGLISSSAIPIASSLAPAGCESTAQGLYSGNYSGLSMALGSIICGIILQILYDPAGGNTKQVLDIQRMFNWISIVSTIITLLLMAKFIFVDRVMGIPGFPRRQSFHK